MICPKCRKIYPLGTENCPECGAQLIALMGEADAPIDANNDNISSLDRVFATDDESNVLYVSESEESFEADNTAYEEETQLDENEEGFEIANEAVFEESEDEIEEADVALEESDAAVEDDVEVEAEQASSYIDLPEPDQSEDDNDIFSFADVEYPESEPILEEQEQDEFAQNDVDDDDDVKIFISSSEESFEVSDSIYTEDYEEQAAAVYYEEEYEVEFDEAEQPEEEYGEAEYEKENEESTLSETHIGAATVYKASSNQKNQVKAEKEASQISEKTTNALSVFIFAAAVIMIIASVICFALGNTTELSEMMVEPVLSQLFKLLS